MSHSNLRTAGSGRWITPPEAHLRPAQERQADMRDWRHLTDADVPEGHPICQGSLTIADALVVTEHDQAAYCVNYSPDGKYIAAIYGNSALRFFDTSNGQPVTRTRNITHGVSDLPSTTIKWHPGPVGENGYQLASACSDGSVVVWTWDAERGRDPSHTRMSEDNNETMCVDYSPDGKTLVSVGSDKKVRVYDMEAHTVKAVMEKGYDKEHHSRQAHSNRIFSVRFASNQTCVSGGWESPLQVWDLRTGRAERQLIGSHIVSDSIDINVTEGRLYAASFRDNKQINVFDYLGGHEIESDSARLSKNLGDMRLYGVRGDYARKRLLALATQPNQLVEIDMVSGDVVGRVTNLKPSMISAAVDPCETRAKYAVSGFEETVLVLDSKDVAAKAAE